VMFIPGPVEVPKSVSAEASRVVNHRSELFRKVIRRLEEMLVDFSSSERVAILSGSGTLAVESMIYSLVSRGEKVIGFSYGEFGNRLLESIRRRGAELVEVRKPFAQTITIKDVREALDSHDDATAVALVHNETSAGTAVRNLREVTKEVKSRGKKVLVDSVSGFAAYEIMVEEWGIDAVATASQKALASVPGVSFVALSSESVRKLRQSDVPSYLDLSLHLKFQDRGETPFTAAVGPVFASLRASEILKEEGLERRWRRHEACARFVRGVLEEWGMKLTGSEGDFSNTVVAVFHSPAEDLVEGLRLRGIEVAKGVGEMSSKMIRIGLMGVVDYRGVNKLMKALADSLGFEYASKPPEECRLPSFIEQEVIWE
jgi:aspartate aminotransferase-like enzyme